MKSRLTQSFCHLFESTRSRARSFLGFESRRRALRCLSTRYLSSTRCRRRRARKRRFCLASRTSRTLPRVTLRFILGVKEGRGSPRKRRRACHSTRDNLLRHHRSFLLEAVTFVRNRIAVIVLPLLHRLLLASPRKFLAHSKRRGRDCHRLFAHSTRKHRSRRWFWRVCEVRGDLPTLQMRSRKTSTERNFLRRSYSRALGDFFLAGLLAAGVMV